MSSTQSRTEIEQVCAQKEAAIESGDCELAATLRDRERKLVRARSAQSPPLSAPQGRTLTVRSTGSRLVWTQWQSMLVGALLLGAGILIGWAIWG